MNADDVDVSEAPFSGPPTPTLRGRRAVEGARLTSPVRTHVSRTAWRIIGAIAALATCLLLFITVAHAADITYVYDELGRLTDVIDPTGDRVTYVYDANGNLLSISRTSSSQVSIISFTPTSGPVGTAVTIYGSGYSPTPSENTVTFNGVAASVTSSTTTSINTTVPAGASTGPIGVTTPAGSATSSTAFTVTEDSLEPTITGFTPTIGPVGTAVTITGTNFQTTPSQNKVAFHKAFATVSASTESSISTTVPTTATTGPISVTTPYGQAVSAADFIIPPGTLTADDIETISQISIGQSVTATIETAGKKDLFTFTANAGQRISIKFTNATMPCLTGYTQATLYNPSGTVRKSYSFCGATGFMDGMVLRETGTYTLVIGLTTGTGSVTFTIYDATLVTGPIVLDGPGVTSSVNPGQDIKLSFNGSAGQRVSVNWYNATLNCPTVRILAPDDTSLNNSISCGSGGFVDGTTLPTTGTYSVYVDVGDKAGGITVELNSADVVTDTITLDGPGVTKSVNIGQDIRLTFDGTAGQRVSVNWYNSSLGTITISLRNPDDSTLASKTSGGSIGYIDGTVLPTDGTYSVYVDNGSKEGSITLELNDATIVVDTIVLDGPGVTKSVNVGQDIRLTFEGTGGQRVSVNWYDSSLGTPTTKILKPDDTTLVSKTSGGSAGYLDGTDLPTTGTYTVFVDVGGTAGSVTLELNDATLVTGTITVNGPSETRSVNIGQDISLTFEGTANQLVTLNWSSSSLCTPVYKILKPDGSTLASKTSCATNGTLGQKTLPTTGTYRAYVDTGGTAGSVTLTLTSP